MVEAPHKFDFAPDGLLALHVLHFIFLIDLKGHLLVVLSVHADVNSGVSALADLLADHVVVHRVVVRKYDNFLFFLSLFLLLVIFFGLFSFL